MGLHTRFYKDKALYNRERELYLMLAEHENFETWLDDLEIMQINYELETISRQNDCNDYRDTFRTWKRDPDGCYTTDVIYSRQECYKWLDDNVRYVYELDNDSKERLKRFWREYPNGVIDFG